MKQRFRTLLQTQRWLKYVPNSLTLCNSLCGFAAILFMLRAYERDFSSNGGALSVFAVSAVVICFAMVFDALDGFAARIFNAASMHGLQMDSLSDMVTFGVAPAALVAIMAHSLRGWELNRLQEVSVYILCAIYLGCAALRLATYNVHAILEKKSSEKFAGLPSPGAAAAVCVAVLFAWQYNLHLRSMAFVLPIYAAVLGLLMVSKIPYIHMGKWLVSVRRNRKRALLLVVMLLMIAAFRIAGIAALVTLYILSGPVCALWQKLRSPEAKVQA